MRKFRVLSAICASMLLSSLALVGCATSPEKKREAADLHLRMGTAFLRQGQYPQALQELLTAEKLEPDNAVIQNNLALAYYVRDKFVEAERHLVRALQLESKYSDARNNLGRVYISQARYDDAIRELNQVTADLTYPTPEKAFTNLALAYLKKNEFAKANDSAQQALKLNRTFCPAQTVYGQSLFYSDKFDRAAEHMDKVVNQCEREKDEARYFSALSHYKLGNKPKATARLEEILSSNQESEYSEKAKTMLGIMR